VSNAAKVLLDISPAIRALLEGIPFVLPIVSGLLGLARPILQALAYEAATCTPEITARSYLVLSSPIHKKANRPWQRDWEIFIPQSNALNALKAAQQYFKQHRICLPLIGAFIRFAPVEAGTLMAHTTSGGEFREGEPGMFFEMPVLLPKKMSCSERAQYEKTYSDLAEMLIKNYGGRAHWAKNRRSLFQLERRLGTFGDNLRRFRRVVKKMDPTGMFANQFGVDLGLRWPQSPPIPSNTETEPCVPT
jgi:hypothetical protein